jgi:2'-hydroxyisoflavone reductase
MAPSVAGNDRLQTRTDQLRYGLRRALRETVADTWAWLTSGQDAVAHERASERGITSDKEAAILATWRARQ